MQTDPNWSNFYFNESQNKVGRFNLLFSSLSLSLTHTHTHTQIYLLDFGATRHFPKHFTDEYLKVIYD